MYGSITVLLVLVQKKFFVAAYCTTMQYAINRLSIMHVFVER